MLVQLLRHAGLGLARELDRFVIALGYAAFIPGQLKGGAINDILLRSNLRGQMWSDVGCLECVSTFDGAELMGEDMVLRCLAFIRKILGKLLLAELRASAIASEQPQKLSA